MPGRYESYIDRATGLRFVFKREDGHPEILHIYARHLTTPMEAIATFRDGETTWDAERRRFETSTDTHTIYWFWLEPNTTVMIITCFRR